MKASALAKLNVAQRASVAALFSGMQTVRPLTNFVRIVPTVHATNPLGFGHGTSRFGPRHLPSRPTPPFGLIYGTVDLATAVFETIIRDSFNLKPVRILRKADYDYRSAVNFSSSGATTLTLLDLTLNNTARYGVPTDVTRYSHHKSGQFFSEFVHSEMPHVDGLLYSSRFTNQLCVAVYDRAIATKLTASSAKPRLKRGLLAPILAPWNVQVL